ncbi:MAG: aminotransferase class V-fold PLP-dependent enzyme [Immundisolibacterales bacterium]|nr:aminotransferase class V-fold PLP-dependent enzyme [Immundisolibacterales bacterium]
MSGYGRGLRHLWALEEDMVFLNHGAYGATPRELFERQNEWRVRMEAQPPRFFMNELPDLVREAAGSLARFVGSTPDRTVLLENATSGMNAVLRSLRFAPGDRIVTTDHVYGAVRNTLRHVAGTADAQVVEVPLPMPLVDPDEVADSLERALDDRTRLVVVDHIASPSALVFPVAEIVGRCRARNIPVLVDGAHAAGQVDLDIDTIGADWYVGNAHKWLCAPKGAAFLAVGAHANAHGPDIHPTTISHAFGQGLTAEFGKIGTRDPSAWLCIPDAIAFHRRLGGRELRERNVALARMAGMVLATALDSELGGPAASFGAMVTVRLPCDADSTWENAGRIRDRLWQDHRVETLVAVVAGRLWLRVSVFAYNDEADFAGLPAAVRAALAADGAGRAASRGGWIEAEAGAGAGIAAIC